MLHCTNTPANIEQVREKMRTISREAEQNFVSTYEQILLEGILKGKQEGIKEGIQKGMQATAKKMKKLGMDHNTIASITNLSLKEIEQL